MTIKSKKFKKGVRTEPTTSPATEEGEIRNDSADNKQKVYTEGAEREIVTADQTQTLSNKTIDSASNTVTVNADEATVSELEVDNLKAGVLETDLNNAVDDTNLPSAKSVKDYVAQEVATKDEASEISYNNVASGLTATDVQAAVDEVEGRLDTAEADVVTAQSTVDNHIADAVDAHDASAISNVPAGNLAATDVQGALNEIQTELDGVSSAAGTAQTTIDDHIADAVDAHDASAISNVPAGNLAATDVQGALDELQTDVDTRALASDLTDHINDAVDAHDASAISNVPTGNLAATTVQGALDELQTDVDTRATDADLTAHTGATSGVHGVTGDVVGTTDTQTLTNKTIDGATITAPAQLDVKQDTFANLTTYATTATNGQIVFATDTKQMFQVVDAGLTAIGGEGGGGTSFDENQVAHGLSVLDAIYHNGTSWVQAQANDAATLATHIVSAVTDVDNFTAQNFGRFEATAHGKTVGEFYFLSESVAGGSDTVEGSVYSAPLYYVEDANTIHALVYRPSLRPQNVQFREDVDVLENILEFDTTSAGFSTNTSINGESFSIAHDASVTRFAEVDLAITPKFRDKILELPVDLKSTATSGNFKVIITDQTNAKTLADEVLQPQDGSETVKRVVSFSTKPVDGDLAIATIRVRFEALAESGAVSDFDDVLVQLKKTQSLEVIAIEQEENVFSARVDGTSAFADIISQSSSFIASTSRPSTGVYNITFKSGFFNEIPAISGTVEEGSTQEYSLSIASVSSTECTVHIATDNGGSAETKANFPFTIIVQRQGSDYRDLTRRVEREISTFKEVIVEEADSAIQVSSSAAPADNVARFINLDKQLGSEVTFLDDASNGSRFVVNSDGIYDVSFTFGMTNFATNIAIAKNAITTLSPNPATPQSEVLAYSNGVSSSTVGQCAWSGYLKAGDVITGHTSNTGSAGSFGQSHRFSISKQGSLKKASVAPDSKIKIPTSEAFLRGATSYGSDGFTVQFDALEKIVGDSIEVSNSDGTILTVKKDGLLHVNSSIRPSGAGWDVYIIRNHDGTAPDPATDDILSNSSESASNFSETLNWSGKVKAGDTFSIVGDGTAIFTGAAGRHIFSAVHQEQDISVAVSNVTPQFEDADSMVRVLGGNGLGSTNTQVRRFDSVQDNLGSAVTYQDSATDGASFTIQETGIYHITYIDQSSAPGTQIGIVKNSIVQPNSLGQDDERLAHSSASSSDNIDYITASFSGVLQAGDIVRATGISLGLDSTRTSFTIAKVGKPSIAEVDVTPFVNLDQQLTERQYVRYNTVNSFGTTNTKVPVFEQEVDSFGNGLLFVENSSTLGTSINVLEDCYVTATSMLFLATPGVNVTFGWSLNSNQLTTDITGINAEDVVAMANSHDNGGNSGALPIEATASVYLRKGDILRPHNGSGSLSGGGSALSFISITAVREEEGRSKFSSIAQTENEFSASITNDGTASIDRESQPFIDSVVRESQGTVRVNFISGMFTEIPSVQATVSAEAGPTFTGTRSAEYYDLDTTGVRIYTKFSDATSNNEIDYNFQLQVSRQGADRKDLQNAIVQLSDMPRVNRTLTQEIRHSAGGNTLVDAGPNEIGFNLSNLSINGDSILKAENVAQKTRFIAQRRCLVNVGFSPELAATGNRSDILKNGTSVITSNNNYTTNTYVESSGFLYLEVGDYITVSTTSGIALNTGPVYLTLTAQAQELERVTNIDKTENVFSARFQNNGTASLISENVEFIDTVTRTSTGAVVITFKSGFFSETPSVTATLAQTPVNGDEGIWAFNESATGVEIRTTQDVAAYDMDFNITAVRQGADYTSIQDVVVGLNPNTIEEKLLTADVTTNGVISSLTFNNLEIGSWYEITGQIRLNTNVGADDRQVAVFIDNGTQQLDEKRLYHNTASFFDHSMGLSSKFKATDTSLTFTSASCTSTSVVRGNGTKRETYVQLTKLSNTEG